MMTPEQVEQMKKLSSEFVSWIYKHETSFKEKLLTDCEIIDSITVCGCVVVVNYINVDSESSVGCIAVYKVQEFLNTHDAFNKYIN